MPKGMTDANITSALWQLRFKIIRDGQDGLEHVNALLWARGCDPDTRRIPPKRPDNRFRKSELGRHILAALRDGPRENREIAAHFASQRPSLSADQAFSRVSLVLSKMKNMGFVQREGAAVEAASETLNPIQLNGIATFFLVRLLRERKGETYLFRPCWPCRTTCTRRVGCPVIDSSQTWLTVI